MRLKDKLLNILGYNKRSTMEYSLLNARKNGLSPNTVIDVGAGFGTDALYKSFPESRHILIEPLEEFAPALESKVQQLKKAEYILAAAYSVKKDVVINVHPDLYGSSLYLENEDSDVNGYQRIVPTITLDELYIEKKTKGPMLIKLDTQGSELDILHGSVSILKETELIIIETSLFDFFRGGPTFIECIEYMNSKGFGVYDIFDLKYRLLDGALSQIDIAFVKNNSAFRKNHYYANKNQREQYNKLSKNNLIKMFNQFHVRK